jgi:hypothetical protein
MITCKNCINEFDGNYCNQCGQPAETHEINAHFLIHDIQHGFFHVEKGILFTVKELFTNPGHSIREYLQGKRVKHFKPISLVLLLAGILGLLNHYFHIDILGDGFKVNGTGREADELRESFNKVREWISSHYALVSLLLLPIFSVGTFFSFRKKGYNFIEHLILNAFLTSQRLVLVIVLSPFYTLLNGVKELKTLSDTVALVVFFLTLWTLVQFFNTTKKSTVFWRTLLSFIISGALFLALAFGGMLLLFFNSEYIKID